MANERPTRSADAVILEVLLYEFDCDDHANTEGKIRRRLRYHGAGPYQQDRIDLLRRLKDQVQAEIHRGERSAYYLGGNGKFAALDDFNRERLTQDLSENYPDVPRDVIATFVQGAIYLYYLR